MQDHTGGILEFFFFQQSDQGFRGGQLRRATQEGMVLSEPFRRA